MSAVILRRPSARIALALVDDPSAEVAALRLRCSRVERERDLWEARHAVSCREMSRQWAKRRRLVIRLRWLRLDEAGWMAVGGLVVWAAENLR